VETEEEDEAAIFCQLGPDGRFGDPEVECIAARARSFEGEFARTYLVPFVFEVASEMRSDVDDDETPVVESVERSFGGFREVD
jgi:hypothetical protein